MQGFFTLSEVQKAKPEALQPRCGLCGLFRQCHSPKMLPYGKGKRKVLIVGEAPGENEDLKGRPFIGKAGRFLRMVLESIDVDLDRDALTTNSIICWPGKGNKMPKKGKEIGWCRPNLTKTIQEFKPNVIITLGKPALVSVIKNYWTGDPRNMERWVGWKIPTTDYWICPTWHPSFLLRSKSEVMDRMFRQHLQAAFELDDEPRPKYEFNKIEILYDENEIVQAIYDIDCDGGRVAFDYETNCLKPEYPNARIYSAAIASQHRTISFPWHGAAIKATSDFLRSKRTKKVGAHIKFEERWTLNKLGHPVCGWEWDNVLAAHALDNREGITSLKFQALVKMGIPSYNTNIEPYFENQNGHYNRIHEIELKTLLTYGGHDVNYELKLAEYQMREMGNR